MEIDRNIAPSGKIYVVRTKSISGRVKDVLNFVQDEFIVSLQTAKRSIKSGSILVLLGSELCAKEHICHYASHGLKAEYTLEDDVWHDA